MTWQPEVGQKVRAKITMLIDLTTEGMGIELCARRGDILTVRKVDNSCKRIVVFNNDMLGVEFWCEPSEIELIEQPKEGEK